MLSKATPLISIIVPIYNVEKYIRLSLESIVSQSFCDYEVILVDDGSPDNCPQICDEYVEKDSRFRVVHQTNKGLSGARNAGMKIARGRFVTFCDPDDKYQPDALEVYSSYITSYNIPRTLYCAGYNLIGAYGDKEHLLPSMMCSVDEGLIKMEENNLCGYTWNKLYERRIIVDNNLSFNENYSAHEDKLFLVQYLKYIDNICLIPDAVYNYYIRVDSLSQNYNNILQRVNALEDALRISQYLRNNAEVNAWEIRWCGAWLKIYLKKVFSLSGFRYYSFKERAIVLYHFIKVCSKYLLVLLKM